MTDERKSELRGLCEMATPSPWMLEPRTRTLCGKTRAVELLCGMNDEDAAFVCLSRTALPELLDDNDAKDKEIERLNAELAAKKELWGIEFAGTVWDEAKIRRLKNELAAEKKRADAAIADLTREDLCDICKHNTNNPDCECDCETCTLECVCKDCHYDDKFEWENQTAESAPAISEPNADTCVVCGAIVPEGRQVCPICEKEHP
jgi:hypothetical protein